MNGEPLLTRDELAAALFAGTIFSKSFVGSGGFSVGKRKKMWASKEERDAWEAHVDETLRRLREAAERILARGSENKASG